MSKHQKTARNAETGRWTYVKLKDGRNIASPVSGGKISKLDIRDAVRVAKEKKSYTSVG